MTFEQTSKLMLDKDYKKRFIAEYWQLKIRCKRLEKFIDTIEAAHRANTYPNEIVDEPIHDCQESLLRAQFQSMCEYLHLLKVRAIIEKIDLEDNL